MSDRSFVHQGCFCGNLNVDVTELVDVGPNDRVCITCPDCPEFIRQDQFSAVAAGKTTNVIRLTGPKPHIPVLVVAGLLVLWVVVTVALLRFFGAAI